MGVLSDNSYVILETVKWTFGVKLKCYVYSKFYMNFWIFEKQIFGIEKNSLMKIW